MGEGDDLYIPLYRLESARGALRLFFLLAYCSIGAAMDVYVSQWVVFYTLVFILHNLTRERRYARF
jgi:hypothetical protein